MLKPFFIWQNEELKKIDPKDVIWFSTEGNYTRIYLADKTFYLVRSSLSGTLKKLPHVHQDPPFIHLIKPFIHLINKT